MKKILSVLCALTLILSMTVCATSCSSCSSGSPDSQASADNGEAAEDEVKIVAEYTLPDSENHCTHHFIIIKNDSDEQLAISSSSTAYDADGNAVGSAEALSDGIHALAPNYVSIIHEEFNTDAEIASYDTTLSSNSPELYNSVIQDLSYYSSDIDGGAVFQVKNNGSDAVENLSGYALYLNDGVLVDYQQQYFTDDDSELKPGETISKEFTSPEVFEAVDFYLEGRK